MRLWELSLKDELGMSAASVALVSKRKAIVTVHGTPRALKKAVTWYEISKLESSLYNAVCVVRYTSLSDTVRCLAGSCLLYKVTYLYIHIIYGYVYAYIHTYIIRARARTHTHTHTHTPGLASGLKRTGFKSISSQGP